MGNGAAAAQQLTHQRMHGSARTRSAAVHGTLHPTLPLCVCVCLPLHLAFPAAGRAPAKTAAVARRHNANRVCPWRGNGVDEKKKLRMSSPCSSPPPTPCPVLLLALPPPSLLLLSISCPSHSACVSLTSAVIFFILRFRRLFRVRERCPSPRLRTRARQETPRALTHTHTHTDMHTCTHAYERAGAISSKRMEYARHTHKQTRTLAGIKTQTRARRWCPRLLPLNLPLPAA